MATSRPRRCSHAARTSPSVSFARRVSGIPGALPPSYHRDDPSFARDLLERAEGAFGEAAARRARAKPVLDAANTADGLLEALRIVLGQDAPLLPPFVLRNGDAMKTALAADLLRDAGRRPVERWLHGVSAVRDRTGFLRQALVVADVFGMALPVPGVAQFPLEAGDRWLGVELPAGAPPPSPKLSLVLLGRDALDTDGNPSVALLVDEWNEVIPGDRETTGIALQARSARRQSAAVDAARGAASSAAGERQRTLEPRGSRARARRDARHGSQSAGRAGTSRRRGLRAGPARDRRRAVPDAIRDRGAPIGDRVPLDFGAAGHGAG